MIKRLDEWFAMGTKRGMGLFFSPVIVGITIIGKTYWCAVLAGLVFVMEVCSLWIYMTKVSDSEDENAKLTKLCVEKDNFGNEHYLIREYNQEGEIVVSTDAMEGQQDEH